MPDGAGLIISLTVYWDFHNITATFGVYGECFLKGGVKYLVDVRGQNGQTGGDHGETTGT